VQAPPSFRDLSLGDFAERLASPDPVPGGGSASAVSAALAASLVAMVATLSQNRPKYADYAALHDLAAPAGRRLSDELLALADEDARAFDAVMASFRLPKGTEAAARGVRRSRVSRRPGQGDRPGCS
jgi:formiminotetrahydrofolate cyclodeaminase